MDKYHTSLFICFVIQACLIAALCVYVMEFGTAVHGFSTSISIERFLQRSNGNIGNESQNNNYSGTSLMVPGVEKITVNNRFIICPKPKSRTGSQMFDFASSLGMARVLNYKFIVRPSNPLLKYFELNQTLGDSVENVQKLHVTEWRQNTWDKTILQHNLTLTGWWRNWKYIDNASDEIRKSFTVKPEFLRVAKQFIQSNNPNNKTLIGVHVRRGDFLNERQQQKGRIVVNKEYLLKAMNWFRGKYTDARFVVVSNDIKWCKKNMPGKDVFFSTFTEPIVDMAIMSLSNHAVMSTGTFSWWAAWLSGGTVIYCKDYPTPGSYLANKTLLQDEFYPPSWIGMTNGV